MDPAHQRWHYAAACPSSCRVPFNQTYHAPSGKKSKPPSFTKEELVMKRKGLGTIAIVTALVSALGGSALSAQDKYTVKVPGGLAFAEFRGYENWQVVAISQDGGLLAAILANPVMIDAYRAGVPGNRQAFPARRRRAKVRRHPTTRRRDR